MSTNESTQSRKLSCFVTDKESETLIRSLSFKEYHMTCEVFLSPLKTAIQYLKNHPSPDVLIVDISESSLPMSEISELSEVCQPGIEVIVIGKRNDIGLFRDLIRAGVRDYLIKPLPLEYLMKNIKDICGMQDNIQKESAFYKSGKIIGVIGATGGVGVSTIVSNLGFVLSENHLKHVSIVDSDLQTGTICHFFDLEPSSGFPHLFEFPDRIDDVLVERYMDFYTPNLGILSAQVGIEDIPKIQMESMDRLLRVLSSRFHFTLVDLSRNFSNGINFHLFQKANLIFIVTDYSLIGLRDAKRILETVKKYQPLNQGIVLIANKVTQYQEGEVGRETFEHALQTPISLEIEFDKVHPLKALTDGIPVSSKKSTSLGRGISELAHHLLGVSSISKTPTNFLQSLKDKLWNKPSIKNKG